jgi:hypothetical protein
MAEGQFGLYRLLAAAEDAEPVASVDVVARSLRERFGARSVSFLFVDLIERELVRLTEEGQTQSGRSAERVKLEGSDYDTVLRTQELHHAPGGAGGQRVIAPVTNRGDTIGVLELTLPHAGDEGDADVLEEIREVAHALAYIIVTDRRFTDLYQWGRRTTPMSLAAEIQHQLLPSASCCQAPEFTLAGTLIPADDVGGDTYDYSLDRETVHLSVTDAMGHDVDAALLATLLVNALRRARRAGGDAVAQARQADQAMIDHGRGAFATGQLLRISLDGRSVQLVNAGHPWPLRLRDGAAEELRLDIDPPFGIRAPSTASYHVQELDLQPGDRLVLYTDGMRERCAARASLPALLRDTADLHPREAVRVMAGAVIDACRGKLPDDATVLCLDWHGTQPAGRHPSGMPDPPPPAATTGGHERRLTGFPAIDVAGLELPRDVAIIRRPEACGPAIPGGTTARFRLCEMGRVDVPVPGSGASSYGGENNVREEYSAAVDARYRPGGVVRRVAHGSGGS